MGLCCNYHKLLFSEKGLSSLRKVARKPKSLNAVLLLFFVDSKLLLGWISALRQSGDNVQTPSTGLRHGKVPESDARSVDNVLSPLHIFLIHSALSQSSWIRRYIRITHCYYYYYSRNPLLRPAVELPTSDPSTAFQLYGTALHTLRESFLLSISRCWLFILWTLARDVKWRFWRFAF